jgi:uncharacterized protein (TIGR00369 family)
MDANELLATIPYLPPHKIEVTTQADEAVTARMPFRREVTNLAKTVHAGALFTLAETVAGVAAAGAVPGGRAMPFLRAASSRYLRRAQSDLEAEARIPLDGANTARRAFDKEGRADLAVDVSITDAEGETVYLGSFDYALREIKR